MNNLPPLRYRTDLVELAARLVPSSACKRAFCNGKVEVLGAFSILPESNLPGYMLSVTTVNRRNYLLAVGADQNKHEYRAWIVDYVPWEDWAGTTLLTPNNPALYFREWELRNGDHPECYLENREGAQKHAAGL